jgi:putative transposase
MPRPLRLDYEGAWHHVMNRAAARARILATDDDKQLLLDCLVEGTRRHAVEIHSYCLMDTHYHLLVRSTRADLSSAMRFASAKITRIKNSRDGRDGPLFRGRFLSVPIETDAHLIQVSRYIHLNPLDARLVDSALNWRWSSAAAYLGKIATPDWLETKLILDMFGPTDPIIHLETHLAAGIDHNTRDFYACHFD